VYLIKPNWRSLLEPYGYKAEYYKVDGEDEKDDHQKKMGHLISNLSLNEHDSTYVFKYFSQVIQQLDRHIERVINDIKPDLIVSAFHLNVASIINSKIPYISILPWNPLWIYEHFFSDKVTSSNLDILIKCPTHIEWLLSKGVDRKQAEAIYGSPFLNVYTCSEDLDYLEFGKLPDNYFRIDNAIRKPTPEDLTVDLSFVKPGEKLVYFTLGSMGGALIDFMQKLLNIFQKSKHKFVVSKGPFQEKIKLYPNMVGDKYINQLKLIPKVDLVIAHGGNNTFMETLYFGKPMILFALWADQHSNAARLEAKKLGRSFDAKNFAEEEVLTAIDSILEDNELKERLEKISFKMQTSDSGAQLVAMAEKIAESNKIK